MANRRCGSLLGIILACVTVLFQAQPAHAGAIALSNLAAVLSVTPDAGTIQFDIFEAFATARAQNSLGELDELFDFEFGTPATINAAVTWASALGGADDLQANASSQVNLPGTGPNAARSAGQGEWSNAFTITGGTGDVRVDFLVSLSGLLSLSTDAFGELSHSEVILNLLLDGDTIAFAQDTHTIGKNDSVSDPFALTRTASRVLQYDTPYSLLMRADSESEAINAAPVPEPSTITLVGLGLAAAARKLARGRSRTAIR